MFNGPILRNQNFPIFDFELFSELSAIVETGMNFCHSGKNYIMASSFEKKIETRKSEKVNFLGLIQRK